MIRQKILFELVVSLSGKVHDASHENLAKFYGMTFQRTRGQMFYISEYCEKGALKKLISSNDLLADIQFRLAFIRDITEVRLNHIETTNCT